MSHNGIITHLYRGFGFIMSSLALYCSFKILLQIVNAPNKDKVRFKKKFLFILYGFSVALDLSCDAIASVLESIMTSNPTIRTQYRSVANRQTRIVKSSIAEMMNLQLA